MQPWVKLLQVKPPFTHTNSNPKLFRCRARFQTDSESVIRKAECTKHSGSSYFKMTYNWPYLTGAIVFMTNSTWSCTKARVRTGECDLQCKPLVFVSISVRFLRLDQNFGSVFTTLLQFFEAFVYAQLSHGTRQTRRLRNGWNSASLFRSAHHGRMHFSYLSGCKQTLYVQILP